MRYKHTEREMIEILEKKGVECGKGTIDISRAHGLGNGSWGYINALRVMRHCPIIGQIENKKQYLKEK